MPSPLSCISTSPQFFFKFQKCPKPSSISSNTFYMDKKNSEIPKNSEKWTARCCFSTSRLLYFSSPSTLECIGAGGDYGAGAEQGRSGARVALERGAHFEGGGDGWSPATRMAGSRQHAVTGTAASGRHAVTGTRRRARGGTRRWGRGRRAQVCRRRGRRGLREATAFAGEVGVVGGNWR